jgi:lipopolysaccharide transport system permease protein
MNGVMVENPQPANATPESEPTDSLPLTVIEPRTGWGSAGLRELWRYRELLFFLAWRDVKIRYKQTILGVVWAVAQPLATMAVFTLFLGRAAGVAEGIDHYSLFVFAGMVAWAFFSNTVSAAALSVVTNERLVTKIYFPRLIMPLSTVGVGLFDLIIAFGLLTLMAMGFGVYPSWSWLLLPVVVVFLALAAAGVGVLLSALVVAQRDFKYALTFGVQLWMFATPCVYMSDAALTESAKWWLPLNPAHGLIAAFRQAALGGGIDAYSFGVSAVVGVLLAVFGVMYFHRVERSFADKI